MRGSRQVIDPFILAFVLTVCTADAVSVECILLVTRVRSGCGLNDLHTSDARLLGLNVVSTLLVDGVWVLAISLLMLGCGEVGVEERSSPCLVVSENAVLGLVSARQETTGWQVYLILGRTPVSAMSSLVGRLSRV